MNKNSTKSQKNNKASKEIITRLDQSPSKKTIDFILSYSKSTKSLLAKKFLVSLN